MIAAQLATCEECRNGTCATCKRYKRRVAARKLLAVRIVWSVGDFAVFTDESAAVSFCRKANEGGPTGFYQVERRHLVAGRVV